MEGARRPLSLLTWISLLPPQVLAVGYRILPPGLVAVAERVKSRKKIIWGSDLDFISQKGQNTKFCDPRTDDVARESSMIASEANSESGTHPDDTGEVGC